MVGVRLNKFSLAALSLIVASALFAEDLPEFERSSVVLRYSGNISLPHEDARKLFKKSIEILQSSNFNSSNPKWEWDEAKINLEYGRAVSGRHVLVTFGKSETIKTIGGDITVRELVVGLNGSQYASSVHTIDSQGKVIGHAKYLGQLCIEIQELANTVASKSPNKTMEPTR
jgi:hypothetical protein